VKMVQNVFFSFDLDSDFTAWILDCRFRISCLIRPKKIKEIRGKDWLPRLYIFLALTVHHMKKYMASVRGPLFLLWEVENGHDGHLVNHWRLRRRFAHLFISNNIVQETKCNSSYGL
jgi:hypothetical protein